MVADGSMSKMSSALLSHPNGEGLGLLEPGILLWTQGGGQCIVCVGHCSGGWPPDSSAVSVPGVLLPVCGPWPGCGWPSILGLVWGNWAIRAVPCAAFVWGRLFVGGPTPDGWCPLIWHFGKVVPTNLAFSGRCAH